jgi:hypothetical protein
VRPADRTLVLVCVKAGTCFTGIHADWTEAINVAIPLVLEGRVVRRRMVGHTLSERCPTLMEYPRASQHIRMPPPPLLPSHNKDEAPPEVKAAEAAWPKTKGALAYWAFFKPSFVASGGLAGALQLAGMADSVAADGRIRDKPHLTVAQLQQLEQAHADNVHIVAQHAGEGVFVPPGWAHLVSNLRPNVKVAWERCRRGWYHAYMQHVCTVVPRFESMAPDYIGVQQASGSCREREHGWDDMCGAQTTVWEPHGTQ